VSRLDAAVLVVAMVNATAAVIDLALVVMNGRRWQRDQRERLGLGIER
jgi:hypothetical protein